MADRTPELKQRSWTRELFQRFTFSAQDLIRGHRFWVLVFLPIIPVVIAALAISSHGSRLTVTFEFGQPEYAPLVGTEPAPNEFLSAVRTVMQIQLQQTVSALFPRPSPGPVTPLGAIPPASHPPITPNAAVATVFPRVKLTVNAKVTNIGETPSSLQTIAWYVVENVDKKRTTIDIKVETPEHVRLPTGEPVHLGPAEGEPIEFSLSGYRLIEYERVRIIEELLVKTLPKERSLFSSAEPYLRLLHASDLDLGNTAVRIANPAHQSQVLFGVEVTDIYGRTATAEGILMDSAKWNQRPQH